MTRGDDPPALTTMSSAYLNLPFRYSSGGWMPVEVRARLKPEIMDAGKTETIPESVLFTPPFLLPAPSRVSNPGSNIGNFRHRTPPNSFLTETWRRRRELVSLSRIPMRHHWPSLVNRVRCLFTLDTDYYVDIEPRRVPGGDAGEVGLAIPFSPHCHHHPAFQRRG